MHGSARNACVTELIEAFRALGEPTRIRAMRIISEARVGLSASDLVRILQKPQYTISTAVSILVDAGLVTETRIGRMVFYEAPKTETNDRLFEAIVCLPWSTNSSRTGNGSCPA